MDIQNSQCPRNARMILAIFKWPFQKYRHDGQRHPNHSQKPQGLPLPRIARFRQDRAIGARYRDVFAYAGGGPPFDRRQLGQWWRRLCQQQSSREFVGQQRLPPLGRFCFANLCLNTQRFFPTANHFTYLKKHCRPCKVIGFFYKFLFHRQSQKNFNNFGFYASGKQRPVF